MSKINEEIEQMAEKMEKSTTSPTDKLEAIIKSLGPAGLKAKLPSLSEEDKLVLKATLEQMNLKKAVSFDDAYAAKMIQGKVTDTIIQEDIASDDADEKLVKPAAAKQNHQGTPTEGWEGQVIKSIQESEETLDLVIEKAMEKCSDDKMVMKKLKEKGMDEGKVQGALDKYKAKKMQKAESDRDKAKEKIMQMEEKEHGTKDPKKLVADEKKEHAMKKSEDAEYVRVTTADGKEVNILKSALPETSNPEVNQVGDAPDLKGGKTMAKKTAAPDIEDVAAANKKNMTKSSVWEDETRLLKANTLGRNFTFNVEQFINDTISNAPKDEAVKKSESTKVDLNDLIEKGQDCTWDDVMGDIRKSVATAKQDGKLVKSFDEVTDLASSMGISEEEARKILGE